MPAPEGLRPLIEKFIGNYKQYSMPEYKEAELRHEFIDPFFELLGWDMHNKRRAAEQYKTVKYEASLEVEGGTKTPDYAFRIGGTTKFYVEAKKVSIDITSGNQQLPAFQLRRYAFSRGLPLSILTNFEKIVVQEIRNITLPRRIIATLDTQHHYCLQSTNVINYRKSEESQPDIRFILGILNSTLINFYFILRYSGNNHIASNQLERIHLPHCIEKPQHDKMVILVERMLRLHKELTLAKNPDAKMRLEREIAATDNEIDNLVYELYGLTDDEIRIVEEEGK